MAKHTISGTGLLPGGTGPLLGAWRLGIFSTSGIAFDDPGTWRAGTEARNVNSDGSLTWADLEATTANYSYIAVFEARDKRHNHGPYVFDLTADITWTDVITTPSLIAIPENVAAAILADVQDAADRAELAATTVAGIGSVLAVEHPDGTVDLTVSTGTAWGLTDNGDGTADLTLEGDTATIGQSSDGFDGRYLIKGQTATVNNVYVSPTGSNGNDGLTAGTPFLTFQKAFDYLATQGPTLQGQWYVNAAAGTYPGGTVATLTTQSAKNRIIVRGPAASGGVPTAVIDGLGGGGGGNYSHGLTATGDGVLVEFRDLKFINFNGDPAGNSRIGCTGEGQANVFFNNVHATNCTWNGVYAFNTSRAYITGGIFANCRIGAGINSTQVTISGATFNNCTEAGVEWGRGAQGHIDDSFFNDNAIGVIIGPSSRCDTVNNNFKRNGIGLKCHTGGYFVEGGTSANIYNHGTADAQTIAPFVYAGYSGSTVEITSGATWLRVACDSTTRNGTATTSQQTLSTVSTIPALRMIGAGKSCRVVVRGGWSVTTGSLLTVAFGGLPLSLTAPAPTTPTVTAFEMDVELMAVPGGYRVFGTLRQGLGGSRLGASSTGFLDNATQAVQVKTTLADVADTIAVYRTDVYLMG